MNFSNALEALKNGKRVSRAGWNGKGLAVSLQKPDSNSKMNLPYLYLEYPDGKRVPWFASQTDLLSDDWNVVVEFVLESAKKGQKLFAYRHRERGTLSFLTTEEGSNQYIERSVKDDVVVNG